MINILVRGIFYFSEVLRYPYQKYMQMDWEVLGIISCHLSVPETFMSPRDEVLVKNALHRLTFLNTWPQPVSLLVKVVKSLGGGASLEELEYGKQTLRFYSLISVLVFFLLSSPSNVKVQRPE